MVHHPWPAAPDVIWYIYSHLYCSSRDGGRYLPSSAEAAPTMGQVPSEFRADWPTFIFQLMTPDIIWHIYSHLYCSSRDGGRDLLSSGRAAPTMRKAPCEFWADQPGYSFSREELRQGSFQRCPAQDGASSMTGGSRCDLEHLLTPVPSSVEAVPTMGQVPCEFEADWPNFIFQLMTPDVIRHIYSHLYCSSRDGGRDLPSSGEAACTMGKVRCEFRADRPNFILQLAASDMIWHIYSGQCCLTGDGAIHLPSSGKVILGLRKFPCKSPEDSRSVPKTPLKQCCPE